MKKDLRFDTLQVHAGQQADSATCSIAVPIYQTTAYVFDDFEHGEALFGLKQAGNIYTRIMNPTNDVFENRMAALEGGVGAIGMASGMAAVTLAVLNIAFAGDNIVSSNSVYGGTYNLFYHTLPKYGVTTTFVDPTDYDAYEKAINDKTKAIFVESLANPNSNLLDFEKVVAIAHKHGIPVIIDNTFATPYLFKPFDYGCDIIVHSASKFICGHGTTLGGVVIDSGKFDWKKSGRFPHLVEPDESYHGIRFTEAFGAAAYIARCRTVLLRDLGPSLAPFNSFLLLQGLETLSLRVEKHVQNALKVAEFLNGHPKVESVNFPSVKGNSQYDLAKKYFPKGAGSIFTIDIKGGVKEAKTFCDSLEIFSYLANVADAKSLAIHPATTTHSQMSTEDLLAVNIKPSTIRLSIGIEDADDLIDDLKQALEKM